MISAEPTIVLDPRAGKPVFRGPRGPVPYVALWSAEQTQDALVVETRQGIAYADESAVDRDPHGLLWSRVTSHHDQWPGWPERAQNTHPPVCLRCARIAVKSCPWLRKGHVAVRAQSFVSGAWGGLYRTGWPHPRPLLTDARTLQFGDPRIHWLQADQLVRELVDCTFVELGRLG